MQQLRKESDFDLVVDVVALVVVVVVVAAVVVAVSYQPNIDDLTIYRHSFQHKHEVSEETAKETESLCVW